MRRPILTFILMIILPWGGRRSVTKDPPDIHNVLDTTGAIIGKTTERPVKDLVGIMENESPEIHIAEKKNGSIGTIEEEPEEQPIRAMENNPLEILMAVMNTVMGSMEKKTAREMANKPPEPASWFQSLPSIAFWVTMAPWISVIVLKYVLRRDVLAKILGQLLMLLELMELFYEELVPSGFWWSSEGLVLDISGLPPLIRIVVEIWSEYSPGLVMVQPVLPAMLLVQLVILQALLVIYFKSKRFSKTSRDNVTIPPSSGDTTPPSTALPQMNELKESSRLRRPSSIPRPITLRKAEDITPQKAEDLTPQIGSVVQPSSASPQIIELRKSSGLTRPSAIPRPITLRRTNGIAPPCGNSTPPSALPWLIELQKNSRRPSSIPRLITSRKTEDINPQIGSVVPPSSTLLQIIELRKSIGLMRPSAIPHPITPQSTDDITPPCGNSDPPSCASPQKNERGGVDDVGRTVDGVRAEDGVWTEDTVCRAGDMVSGVLEVMILVIKSATMVDDSVSRLLDMVREARSSTSKDINPPSTALPRTNELRKSSKLTRPSAIPRPITPRRTGGIAPPCGNSTPPSALPWLIELQKNSRRPSSIPRLITLRKTEDITPQKAEDITPQKPEDITPQKAEDISPQKAEDLTTQIGSVVQPPSASPQIIELRKSSGLTRPSMIPRPITSRRTGGIAPPCGNITPPSALLWLIELQKNSRRPSSIPILSPHRH